MDLEDLLGAIAEDCHGIFQCQGPLRACAGLVPVSLTKGLTGLARCIQTSPTAPSPHPPSLTRPLCIMTDWTGGVWLLIWAGSHPPPLPPVPLLDHGDDPQPQALIHRYTTRVARYSSPNHNYRLALCLKQGLVRARGGLSSEIS